MSLLMYADDLCVLADSEANLQNGLDILDNYCENWNLKVNAAKFKVIIFSKKELEEKPTFTYRGEELEVVDDFKLQCSADKPGRQ